MSKHVDKCLIIPIVGILTVTAMLKLWTVLGGHAEYRLDPVLYVTLGTSMLIASIFELGLSVVLVLPIGRELKAASVTLTGFYFLLYHLAMRLNHFYGHCPCVGMVWKSVGVHSQYVSLALALFIFSSGIFLVINALRGPR